MRLNFHFLHTLFHSSNKISTACLKRIPTGTCIVSGTDEFYHAIIANIDTTILIKRTF